MQILNIRSFRVVFHPVQKNTVWVQSERGKEPLKKVASVLRNWELHDISYPFDCMHIENELFHFDAHHAKSVIVISVIEYKSISPGTIMQPISGAKITRQAGILNW